MFNFFCTFRTSLFRIILIVIRHLLLCLPKDLRVFHLHIQNQNTASLIFNMRAVSHVRNKTVKYIALAGDLLSANCNVPM